MTDLLIDPDCAGGKHGSCVGDPCECDCHTHKPLGIDPGEPDEGPFCECGEHYPCEAIRALPDAPATPEAEPFHLTLRFNAPSGEAAKRAGFIADLCAAEFGTSDPRLTPADGDLRDRYAEALRLHYADEDALYCACGARIEDWDAHLADAVAAVRDTELERLRARVAELETTPVDWDAQRRRADELEATVERLRAELANVQRGADTWKDAADGWEERAERLTAERDEQRQRAERAEAERDALKAALAVHTGCRRDLSIGDLLRSASAPEKPGWLTWEKLMGTPAPETPAVLTDAPESPCSLCGGTGIVPGTEEPEINASGEPCDCQILPTAPETRMRPVSVESPGNDGFRYEPVSAPESHQEDA